MDIDFEQLKELLEIVSQNDISELTVESGEECITVKKPPAPHLVAGLSPVMHTPGISVPGHLPPHAPGHPEEAPVPGPNGAAGAPQPAAAPQPPEPAKDDFLKITSPMVGTFYRSTAPSKPPFVEVGDTVTVGQTVCIIEAMKLMNDFPSEISGRIVEILASNGATVEYGQTLFLVDPGNTQ